LLLTSVLTMLLWSSSSQPSKTSRLPHKLQLHWSSNQSFIFELLLKSFECIWWSMGSQSCFVLVAGSTQSYVFAQGGEADLSSMITSSTPDFLFTSTLIWYLVVPGSFFWTYWDTSLRSSTTWEEVSKWVSEGAVMQEVEFLLCLPCQTSGL
jgi:hypothetical protein